MAQETKAIIFDWAGVFCTPGEPFSHPELAKVLHLSVDEMGTRTREMQNEYYAGQISGAEFWQKIIKFFGLKNLPASELSRAYLASYSIYPEMLELALKLKSHYRTMLLSNLTAEMMADILEKYQIKNYFHQTIFSNEIGLIKPDRAIFELATERLGLKTEEILFIDDSPPNVRVAAALGFQTILFENPPQCRTELVRLGIKI